MIAKGGWIFQNVTLAGVLNVIFNLPFDSALREPSNSTQVAGRAEKAVIVHPIIPIICHSFCQRSVKVSAAHEASDVSCWSTYYFTIGITSTFYKERSKESSFERFAEVMGILYGC